ncbi:MAG: type transport system ATP-binding protein, partial [Mycobacteriales bacterium]
LRSLLGLVTPSAGTATIGGLRYADLAEPAKTVGAVLEASSFHPARTARNHLRVYCAAAGIPDQRADEVLASVGLDAAADRKVKGFSLGMRQRLGLAFALIGDPQVLILDEPANGLDPDGIRWLRGFMRNLADTGRTVLVSSHLLGEVEQVADRVVIVTHGRLVREGTLAELGDGQSSSVLARSPQADQLAETVRGLAGAAATRVGLDELRVSGVDAAAVGHAAFVAGIELHELATQKSDLEDIFFELTGDGAGPGDPIPVSPADWAAGGTA